MNEFLLFLPTALVALGSFGFGWLVGYVRGAASMRPCEECGSAKYARAFHGMGDSWICRDRDGCESRLADREFELAMKKISANAGFGKQKANR